MVPTAAEMASEALGQIGPAARAALPALREVCQSKDPRLARAAQQAVGRIAPAAPDPEKGGGAAQR